MHWWVYPFIFPVTVVTVSLAIWARVGAEPRSRWRPAGLLVGVLAPYLGIIVAVFAPGRLFTRPITSLVLALLCLAGLAMVAFGPRTRTAPTAGRHAGSAASSATAQTGLDHDEPDHDTPDRDEPDHDTTGEPGGAAVASTDLDTTEGDPDDRSGSDNRS